MESVRNITTKKLPFLYEVGKNWGYPFAKGLQKSELKGAVHNFHDNKTAFSALCIEEAKKVQD